MLVLARQTGQEILVGDEVRIVVLESRKGQVKIGIEAPRDVHIVRKELIIGSDGARLTPASALPENNLAASLEVA